METVKTSTERLRVFYAFNKVNKIAKKRELSVVFENSWSYKSEEWIKKRMILCATRFQTEAEMEDGKQCNRQFTCFRMFIDDKPFFSDINRVLDFNKQADSKNVDMITLQEIYDKCLEKFKEYNRMFPAPKKSKTKEQYQLTFDF